MRKVNTQFFIVCVLVGIFIFLFLAWKWIYISETTKARDVGLTITSREIVESIKRWEKYNSNDCIFSINKKNDYFIWFNYTYIDFLRSKWNYYIDTNVVDEARIQEYSLKMKKYLEDNSCK